MVNKHDEKSEHGEKKVSMVKKSEHGEKKVNLGAYQGNTRNASEHYGNSEDNDE